MPTKSKRIVCPVEIRDVALEELQTRCTVDPVCGCWIKNGKPNPKGYCTVSLLGLRGLWHRVAYAIANGECPENCLIDHKCRTRSCGNPEHLLATDSYGNMAAMVARGSHWHAVKPESVPKGRYHYASKFTDEQVLSIWKRLDAVESRSSLSKEFNVPVKTIDKFAWRHNHRYLLSDYEKTQWPPAKKTPQKTTFKGPYYGIPTSGNRKQFFSRLVHLSNGCSVLRKTVNDHSPAMFFSIGGRTTSPHQAAWIIENGPIPDGLIIRHTCNEGHNGCCNINHLVLGTHKDNSRDLLVAGHCKQLKLSPSMVLELFQLFATGKFTSIELADRFQVSFTVVCKTLNRQSHKQVPVPDNVALLVRNVLAKRNSRKGDDSPVATITTDQAVSINKLWLTTSKSQSEIGAMFGVSQKLVNRITTGARWHHIHPSVEPSLYTECHPIVIRGQTKLSNDQVVSLNTEWLGGDIRQSALARKYNVSTTMVCNIVNGKMFRTLHPLTAPHLYPSTPSTSICDS